MKTEYEGMKTPPRSPSHAGGEARARGKKLKMGGGSGSIGLVGLGLILFLWAAITLGPQVWAHWQLNRFMQMVGRVWTLETLIPAQDACPPAAAGLIGPMARFLEHALPAIPEPKLHQGQLACLQGRREEARDHWQAGLERMPVDPQVVLWAAIASFPDRHIVRTPYRDAIGHYGMEMGERYKNFQDLAWAWYRFAFVYEPSAQVAERLAQIRSRMGDPVAASDVWLQLQAAFPEDAPDYWWAVARELEQRAQWDAAARAYEQAATRASGTEAYRLWVRAGDIWLRKGRFEDARQDYQQAVSAAPYLPQGYLGVGKTYRYQKNLAEAEKWFRKAAQMAPEHYASYYYLGIVIREQGRPQEALTYLQKALDILPNNAYIHYQMALTLRDLGRTEEAIAALQEAIHLSSTPPQAWQELLHQWETQRP